MSRCLQCRFVWQLFYILSGSSYSSVDSCVVKTVVVFVAFVVVFVATNILFSCALVVSSLRNIYYLFMYTRRRRRRCSRLVQRLTSVVFRFQLHQMMMLRMLSFVPFMCVFVEQCWSCSLGFLYLLSRLCVLGLLSLPALTVTVTDAAATALAFEWCKFYALFWYLATHNNFDFSHIIRNPVEMLVRVAVDVDVAGTGTTATAVNKSQRAEQKEKTHFMEWVKWK